VGQCSSAATSASCARSSAWPTSRTRRATAATIRADSMRQSASIVRRTSRSMPRVSSGVVQLRAQAVFLLADLRGVVLAEVLRLEARPDLDLGFSRHWIRAAAHPFQRLVHRPHLPDPVAGNQLLRLGEGTIDDGAGTSREAHALAAGGGLQ